MNKTVLLVFQLIKVMGGVIAGSLVLTQKFPLLTIIIGAIAAGANEIIIFNNKHTANDPTNSPDA